MYCLLMFIPLIAFHWKLARQQPRHPAFKRVVTIASMPVWRVSTNLRRPRDHLSRGEVDPRPSQIYAKLKVRCVADL